MRGQWRVIRPSDNIARMKFRIRPILAVSLVLLWLFDQSLLFLWFLVIWPFLVILWSTAWIWILVVSLVSLWDWFLWSLFWFGIFSFLGAQIVKRMSMCVTYAMSRVLFISQIWRICMSDLWAQFWVWVRFGCWSWNRWILLEALHH